MKTTIILISSILYLSNAFCQTEKGKFILGGTISPSYHRNKSNNPGINYSYNRIEKTLSISTDLKFGYFLIKNFAIGINPNFSVINNSYDQDGVVTNNIGTTYQTTNNLTLHDKYNYRIFQIDPFLRYYLLRRKRIGVFVEGAAGFSNRRRKITYNDSGYNGLQTSAQTISRSFFNYKCEIGINYFITDKAGIELNLNYQGYNNTESIGYTGFYQQNLSCFIGLMLFL